MVVPRVDDNGCCRQFQPGGNVCQRDTGQSYARGRNRREDIKHCLLYDLELHALGNNLKVRIAELILVLLLTLGSQRSERQSFVWWTTNALVKVRPSDA